MSLPNLPAGDKFRREVRTEWGGINLNENAGDGELVEAINMSSREYPLLATEWLQREGSPAAKIYLRPYIESGLLGYIVDYPIPGGTHSYKLYDPTNETEVSTQWTQQQVRYAAYAQMPGRLFIFPRKQVYDFSAHELEAMEVFWMCSDSGQMMILDGTLYGVPAECNTIWCPGVNFHDYFRAGDAVMISDILPSLNGMTAVIREVVGDELHFSENTFDADWWYASSPGLTALIDVATFTINGVTRSFTLGNRDIQAGTMMVYKDGEDHVTVWDGTDGGRSYPLDNPAVTIGTTVMFYKGYANEPGFGTISRNVPNMDFVCVNENRMWGCKGDTIYASKLGDPLNWNVFDGLSTDSWTAETGTPGNFTGCCSYQGYPTFFKENAVFKVLGDEPSNFVLRKQNIDGVAEGCSRSIVEIRGKLYYISQIGAVEWNGGDYPAIVSHALGSSVGTLTQDAAYAGTDGIRYFVTLTCAGLFEILPHQPPVWVNERKLFVYDPRFGTWHEMELRSSEAGLPEFAWNHSKAYMLGHSIDSESQLDITTVYLLSKPGVARGEEDAQEWRVTFADSTRAYKTALTGSESKKGVLRLLIRCRLAKTMKVWISYDGGDFEEAGEFGGEDGMDKTSRVVPLILRRCDYWQLRLTGVGDAVIYSIAVEKYGGEWQQA